jgi:hypothetical protein
MCPLKSKTLRGIVPESSFDIAGTLQVLPPAILTIFSCAGYCGHRLHQKQRPSILFSFAIRSLFEPGRGLINPKRVMYLATSALRSERTSGLAFSASALCQGDIVPVSDVLA